MIQCLLLAFISAASTTVSEASATAVDSISEYDEVLNEVVVTGVRAPKLLKNTPVQTTLITSRMIERSDATDIEELLQEEIPGVEFSYAMNQQVHFNYGGFGGQGVLFLIDGERLVGETMDDVDFGRINMSGVERIEIVRGASSALYGSNAAGGVINVITKVPKNKWHVGANIRYGRHNSQRYGINLQYRNKIVANSLSGNYSSIKTYDVHSSPDPITRVITQIYGNRTFNVKDQLVVTPLEGIKFTARAGYYFREIPRITDTPERYRDYSGGLKGQWDINDNHEIEIAYAFDQYDKSNYMKISGLDVRNYSNVQNSIRAIYNYTDSRGDILTVGGDYRYDYLDNTKIDNGAKHEANADVFAQYDWIIDDKWELVGAARYDYFSKGDISRVTPKISARYRPSYNTNVRMAYGMGFRTPTLKEQYYNFDMAGIWIVEGTPSLEPETSHNFNGSFDWWYRNYSFTVTAYYNHIIDRIATGLPYSKVEDPSQLYLKYVNLAPYDIMGGEATVEGRWNNGLSAKLSYALTHEVFAKDKDGNPTNNQYIPARKHSLTARVDWNKKIANDFDFTIGVNGRYLSGVTNIEYKDYYDITAGTTDVRYPAYTLWKLSGSLMFCDRYKLTLALDNLFNYKPKYYYLNAPLTDGANFMVGLSINLD